MRGKGWTIVAGILAFWAPSAAAQAPEYFVQVRARGFWARPSGTVRGATAATAGTRIDLQNDMNLNRPIIPDGEILLRARPAPVRVAVSGWMGTATGSQTTNRAILYDNTTYAAATTLRSQYETLAFSARWAYEFGIPLDPTEAIFSPGLGAEYMEVSGTVRGTQAVTGLNVREASGGIAVMPLLGFTLEIPFYPFEIEASAWGWGYLGSFGNINGSYWEASAGLKFFPMPSVFLEGGYRIHKLNGTRNNKFEVNARWDGFYAGLGARF